MKGLVGRVQFFYALPFYILFLLNVIISPALASPVRDVNVRPLSLRTTFELRNETLNATLLEKRGPCVSKLCCFTGNEYQCTPGWPSFAALIDQVDNYGNVGRQTSLFYTGLGGQGAIAMAKQWACSNGIPNPPGWVAFDTIVDPGWVDAQGEAIIKSMNTNNLDPFQKLLSQAFAAVSKGDVYLFTPYNADPLNIVVDAYHKTAWAGWEYPQLTRNPAVTAIYRVDPQPGAPDNDRHLIWSPSDGPSANPPLGLYFPPPSS